MAQKKTRRNSKLRQSEDAAAKKRVLSKATVEATPKISWRQRVLKFLPLMLLALFITFVSSRTGLLNEWQTISLNTQMRLDLPAEESEVVIVDITQQDFDQVFAGQTNPLNPDALQRVVAAIAKGQPCVIGVDIDTSFSQFKNFKVSEEMSNVIWARETAEMPENIDKEAIPLDVLGGQNPEYNKKSGIPFLINDAKNIPRFYTRLIKTTEGESPSFAWAVFKEGKSRNCAGLNFPELEETEDRFVIGYSRGKEGAGRTKISASKVLEFSENPDWQNNNLIKGKIVLLGGTYLNQDKTDTPLGMMRGVEITANVIESDLRGAIKPPSFLSMTLLQIFDGVLLIALFQIFSWRKAFLFSLAFIPALSLACSFFSYYSFSYWLLFAPVMVGVVLTELIDKGKDYFKKSYKSKVRETYQELGGKVSGENQLAISKEVNKRRR